MWIGVLYLIGASALFGCLPTVNKLLLLHGLTSGSLVFLTYLTVAAASGIALIIQKKFLRVPLKQCVTLMILGFLGMGATAYLLNLSYTFIPVGLSTMLHFSYPTLVVIITTFFFKEKFNTAKVYAILASFLGMFLIANLSGGGEQIGILFALTSGMTYALYIVGNDKGTVNRFPLLLKIFYASAGTACIFGIQTLGNISLPSAGIDIFLLFGVCGLGTLAAYYFLTKGIKLVGAVTASFFNMLEPIFSLLISTIVYQDALEIKSILGGILILSAVFIIAASPKLYQK